MEQTISFEKYKKMFDDYAAHYDKNDGRVALKIIHTDAVVAIMDRICEMRQLPEHTKALAHLCAQFHDIGRFEQLRQYDTFLDHVSVDHAKLSCQVLKDTGMLNDLTDTDRDMVLTAIANHNKLEIDPSVAAAAVEEASGTAAGTAAAGKEISGTTAGAAAAGKEISGTAAGAAFAGEAAARTKPSSARLCFELCKLVRDADKCDIFRVFATDDMKDVVGATEEQIAHETITPEVLDDFRRCRCTDKRIRKTCLDYWIGFLGFFFDFNYPESVAIAREQGYYRMPFDRTQFADPKTRKQVDECLAILEQYLDRTSGRHPGQISDQVSGQHPGQAPDRTSERHPGQTPGQASERCHGQILEQTPDQAPAPETIPPALRQFFEKHPSLALAFSGGTDSAYLLYAATACGCDVRAYYASSPFQPAFELEDAKRLARSLNAKMTVLPLNVLENEIVRSNPADRCYYCKNAIFGHILEAAAKDGYTEIIDGTNASDDAGDRPGMRALRELRVLSPLRLCGITKKALREYSRNAGLFTWDKPAYACLATRVPTGTPIDANVLKKVEWAETELARMGFTDFRVRVFPTPVPAPTNTLTPVPAPTNTDFQSPQDVPTPAPAPAGIDVATRVQQRAAESTMPRVWTARLQLLEDQLPLLLTHRQELYSLLKAEFSDVLLDLNARAASV